MRPSGPVLPLRDAGDCEFDLVSLGEVMLRLDPGEGRIRTARTFRAAEGGGEYNVARGLRRVFGMRTALVTAFADNEVGRLLEELVLAGGVDTRLIRWAPFDGIGRCVRNGLNFTERGFGVRAAVGISDRANSAASQLVVGEVDWDWIFGDLGVRWFHTGGIFAGLSATTAEVAREAMLAARRNGTVVSYDLNYRPSLWKSIGGPEGAREVNRGLAPLVDVMIGNEEDFTAGLGIARDSTDEDLTNLEVGSFRRMITTTGDLYPNFHVVATTLREVRTATSNDWGAIAWSPDGGFAEATHRPELEILDRVGGGDSFASGLVYGLMNELGLRQAVEIGAAHGALAMSTPGDTSMATRDEVFALVDGKAARVER